MSETWNLTPAQEALVATDDQDSAFIWLFELPVPDDSSPRTLRLCNQKRAVQWGTRSDGSPVTWDPFPFAVAPLREDSEGTLEYYRVSLANISREIGALVEAFDGFAGQRAKLRLVTTADLDSTTPLMELAGGVLSVSVGAEVVQMELGEPDLSRIKFPRNRCAAQSCGHTYRGARCGYIGALPSCDKSLDGPNGCQVHENEARWGGFRGIISRG